MDTLISIVIPILLGVLIDEIVYYQNFSVFFRVCGIMLFVLVFSSILYFFIYTQHQYLMGRFVFDIKMDLFRHLHKCQANDLSEIAGGDAVTTILKYSSESMFFIIRNVLHFFNGIFKLIVLSIILLTINWKIGMFVLIVSPFSVYASTKIGKKLHRWGDEQKKHYATYAGWLFEIINGIREIRMLGAEKKVMREFDSHHYRLFRLGEHSSYASLLAERIISFINLVILLAIYTLCGLISVYGRLTVGHFLLIILLYGLLTEQIKWTSSSYLDAQTRITYIQHIREYLDMPTENNDGDLLDIKDGNICFQDIDFSYSGSPPLYSGLCLQINGGEHIAITGASGCGKSTLAYLLLKFYSPENGKILIDGMDIGKCSARVLREKIGFVSQNFYLFDGTVRENITLGNPSTDDSKIENACRKAEIWEHIQKLPHGLDTMIGPDNIDLSGGQKQRLLIARVYLRDPKILIFDEATSALDASTEVAILEAWNDAFKGRTAIVISHRINVVQLCDRVAVMKNGKIKNVGTPKEMMLENSDFKELFNLR